MAFFTSSITSPHSQVQPSKLRLYFLVLLSCLGSWMFGYQNGVISGVLVLPAFEHDFKLPAFGTKNYNNITANIVTMIQFGGLAGSLATFVSMKYLGRKLAMAIAALTYLCGALLQTFSNGKLSLMYSGRLITGIGTASATVVVPLYIAELSPPAIRGSLVGLYEINNQLSSLLGYWMNYIANTYIAPTKSLQWQLPISIQIIPSSLLLLACLFILPETPRFLAQIHKEEEAREVLAWVRNLPVDDASVMLEMQEIEDGIRNQETERVGDRKSKWGIWGELWWKGNRRRVIIGVCLMVGQNLTGIQGVNFYTPTIFRSIGFQGTRVGLLASGMYALVKTLTTIFSLLLLIDRLGRRKLLLASSIGISLSLWYIGAFVFAKHIDLEVQQPKSVAGWFAIVAVYVYAASFSIAWNGVVWVYCAEIFPSRIKELAISLTTAVQWLTQFATARVSPIMLTSWHGGFFLFFAGAIAISGVAVWIFVPETKGRTLEGMDAVFGNAYGAANNMGDENEMRDGVVAMRGGEQKD